MSCISGINTVGLAGKPPYRRERREIKAYDLRNIISDKTAAKTETFARMHSGPYKFDPHKRHVLYE